jgi:FMN-dependent NADH-azoreductase
MRLLHIDSSAGRAESASRELTAAIVARWLEQHPDGEVTRLDLDADPLPHLTATTLARQLPADTARATRVLEDFLAADVVVIGAPMYNFFIPSTLKAWIDRISVPGRTFRYAAGGMTGLAGDKRVIVVLSRGGFYAADTPGEFIEPYFRFLFDFLGIDDVHFVRAEGLSISADHRAQGLAAAYEALTEVHAFTVRR